MGAHLLNSFSRMVESVPPGAIAAVVEREGQMLADDLAHGRTLPAGELRSILSFCHFLAAVRTGGRMQPVPLPMTDTAFYRKTTERLIQAGKLPGHARERFDAVFSVPALKSLLAVS